MRVYFGLVLLPLLMSFVGVPTFAQDKAEGQLPASKIEFGVVGLGEKGFSVTSFETQTETKTQTYTVEVPYTVTENGNTETKTRMETRTRDFTVQRPVQVVAEVPAEAVTFSSAGGKRITDLAVVRKALAKPRPAVITYAPAPLESFYRQLLNPSTVVIHIDQSKLRAEAPAPAPVADDPFGEPAPPPPTVADPFGN